MSENLSRITHVVFDKRLRASKANAQIPINIEEIPISSNKVQIKIASADKNEPGEIYMLAVDQGSACVVGVKKGDFYLHMSPTGNDAQDPRFSVEVRSQETDKTVKRVVLRGLDQTDCEIKAARESLFKIASTSVTAGRSFAEKFVHLAQTINGIPAIQEAVLASHVAFVRKALRPIIIGDNDFHDLVSAKIATVIAHNSLEAAFAYGMRVQLASMQAAKGPDDPNRDLLRGGPAKPRSGLH